MAALPRIHRPVHSEPADLKKIIDKLSKASENLGRAEKSYETQYSILTISGQAPWELQTHKLR